MKAKIKKVLSGSSSNFEIAVEFLEDDGTSICSKNLYVNLISDDASSILEYLQTLLLTYINTYQEEKACKTKQEVINLIDQEIQL